MEHMASESPTLLELAKAFQTLIGAAAGFIGVIITLRVNARNARQLEEQRYQTARSNIASALLGELRVLLAKIDGLIATFKSHGAEPVTAYIGRFSSEGPILDAVLGSIGYLKPATVQAVCAAYSEVRSLPQRFLFGENVERIVREDGIESADGVLVLRDASVAANTLARSKDQLRAAIELLDEST
jgi:hypothetical protein